MKIKMRTKLTVALICTFVAACSLTSCSRHNSKDDKTISVSGDDAEMNAAIAKARASLPDFWQVYEKREQGESDFSLKVKITDNGKIEHFWVVDIERKDGKITGTINNDPDIVHNVKLGDKITVNEPDISDWLYLRNGKMVGNYTLRVLFKQMSKEEVEKFKQMLADP
jgi:uncharacterized protein YegJ (DUF2314 family)